MISLAPMHELEVVEQQDDSVVFEVYSTAKESRPLLARFQVAKHPSQPAEEVIEQAYRSAFPS